MIQKLHHTRIGTDLYIHDDSAAVAEHIRSKIVPDGDAAHYENGTAEWIIDEVVDDPTKSGSGRYTWDKSGNRVKHARVRYTKDAAGRVTRNVEGVIFKKF